MDQVNVSAWVGREQQQIGAIDVGLSGMIHATIGRKGTDAPASGAAMPPLWHWCAYPPLAPMSALGRDGHPRTGDFLPPIRLERRMWAGGALTFHQLVHVGEVLTRRSQILSVTEKDGNAGSLVFVRVRHLIHGAQGLAITEDQDIVYLQIPDRFDPPRKLEVPDRPDFDEDVTVSEALLFRYSAVTFNAHRIHYDLPYARDVERYPGLVVHGPLQAALLADAATHHHGRPPSGFRFRGVHPLFHSDGLRLVGQRTAPDTFELCTAAASGHQALQATATWKETDT